MIRGTVRTEFTPKPVMDAVEKSCWTVLGKFGTYTRQRDRGAIKPGSKKGANKISRAGMPPYSHTNLLRDLIVWARDRERMSVVIGVAPLNKPGKQPSVIEHGGYELLKRHGGKYTLAKYEARPHTGPAFEKVIDTQLDKLFENSLKG